jgi:hypothetical protein
MLNLLWKGLYLEPKRVLQRVILWGQPKIPFRFWIAPVFLRVYAELVVHYWCLSISQVHRNGDILSSSFIAFLSGFASMKQPTLNMFCSKEGKYILQGDTIPAVIRYYPRVPFFCVFRL